MEWKQSKWKQSKLLDARPPNQHKMNRDTLKYLKQNFCSLDELAERSKVTPQQISQWISDECLPAHSYRLDQDGTVHSFFGVLENVAEPGIGKVLYFNPSHVEKIQALQASEQSSDTLSAELKRAFFEEYATTLANCAVHETGMADFIRQDGGPGPQLDELMESEWSNYLQGTYGLCTRNADTVEIATKEAMIRKIKFLTEEGSKSELSDTGRQQLSEAINSLDQVSSEFAPHEFECSSRNRFIVLMRQKYQLSTE